jgi:signal transduction histidine kinase
LIILAELSLTTAAQLPQLGLRAEAFGDRVIITQVLPAGVAWEAQVRPGDQVLSVADAPVTPDDAPTLNVAPKIQVRSISGAVLTTSVAKGRADFSPISVWSFPLVAACFVLIGMLVFVLAADAFIAWSVLGLTIAMAMTLLAARSTYQSAFWALAVVFAGIMIFGISTFMLFLIFPVNRLRTLSGRVAAAVALSATLALMLAYPWIILMYPARYNELRRASSALVALELLGACALLGLTALRRRSRQNHQDVLGLLGLGMAGAVAPFALFSLIPIFIGIPLLAPPEIAILSIVLLPLSLGIAILRGQFAMIEYVARRGLVAIVVWSTLLATYSVLFMSLIRLLDPAPDLLSRSLWMAPLWIAAIGITFPIAQRGLRHRIEQILFHDVYAYADTLQHLSITIAGYTMVEDIAPYVLDQLGRKLGLRWAALELRSDITPPKRYDWGERPPRADQAALPNTPAHDNEHDAAYDDTMRHVGLVAGRTMIGLLTIGPKRHAGGFTSNDEAFISTLAPLVATALHNAVLIGRLQDQVAELAERGRSLVALNAQLMQVQEEERQRIALDLHDDTIQRVMLLERELIEAEASPQVQRWRQAVEDIVAALRTVCAGLRPPVLDDLGLIAGIEWLVNDLRASTDLDVALEVVTADQTPFGRLEAPLEIALYRVAQEALTNCRKHAQASHVVVSLSRDHEQVVLRIADDGRGFDSSTTHEPSALHLGILGMRQRLRPWSNDITLARGVHGGMIVSVAVALRKKSDND